MWGQAQIEISPGNIEKKEIVLRRLLCRHVAPKTKEINRSKVQCHSIYLSVSTSHRQIKAQPLEKISGYFSLLYCTL